MNFESRDRVRKPEVRVATEEESDANVAFDLVEHGLDHAERNVMAWCDHECRQIELEDEPKIQELAHRGRELQAEEAELENLLRYSPPLTDQSVRRLELISSWIIFGGLFLASTGQAAFTLGPFFRKRIEGWLIYPFIALTSLFFVHQTLRVWEEQNVSRLRRWLISASCVVVLSATILFSFIRAGIFVEQLSINTAPVLIEGETMSANGTDFYKTYAWPLGFALALFSLGAEIGSGMAWGEVKRWTPCEGKSATLLQKRQTKNRAEQRRVLRPLEELRNRAPRFKERVKANVRSAVSRWLERHHDAVIIAILLGALASPHARAAQGPCVTLLPDLTASVADARGLDGKSEMERNIAAVTQVLAQIPVGSQVSVIAITNRTFSSPYVLLAARIDGDPGYFQERIKTARTLLARAWQKRAGTLAARFGQSDVMGALVLAAQSFQARDCSRKTLVIFSDMRQETPELNVAQQRLVAAGPAMLAAEQHCLIPELTGVEVYALGVDAADRSVAYWQSLRDFWTEYFRKSGASLKRYSIFREFSFE